MIPFRAPGEEGEESPINPSRIEYPWPINSPWPMNPWPSDVSRTDPSRISLLTEELSAKVDPETLENACAGALRRLLALYTCTTPNSWPSPVSTIAPLSIGRATIANLVANGRHLQAFRQALGFAYQRARADVNDLLFSVRLTRISHDGRTAEIDSVIPSIDIVMEISWENTWVQQLLARYLVAWMRQCYHVLQFPDWFVVRELQPQFQRQLLVPGVDQEFKS
ncbi:hypothetical protein GGS24DRAFT_478003 [Hypoxylon argillaceum]|nr:hypothetical protein GGS24DRAFT_478003 [Hypoxylon argillaceum]KAI1146239.1 hypothetical protein F4825DRAFT_472809 [Nemania diffusa]